MATASVSVALRRCHGEWDMAARRALRLTRDARGRLQYEVKRTRRRARAYFGLLNLSTRSPRDA